MENEYTRKIEALLDGLNDQQRAAVLQRDGAVLIVAGAGSGKTRVITSRIALHLLDGTAPERILALTFTRKAASEMKDRIRTLSGGNDASRLVMGTFHSVFVQFLREWSSCLGFPENFTIYDADDSLQCIEQCTRSVLFGPDWKETAKTLTKAQKDERKAVLAHYKGKEVQSIISRAKNDLIGPKAYRGDPDINVRDARSGRPRLGEIYESYMKACKRAAAMDFDDILLYMNHLLERNPQVRWQLSRRFDYVLVDEYQDTNGAQYSIIRQLVPRDGNICVVGDDSQSIYAFRGAQIRNIYSFRYDWPQFSMFKLEYNYRSGGAIVEAANRLIAHNTGRIPKTCVAVRGAGFPIHVRECPNERYEAALITGMIADAGQDPSQIAVLYRTNAQSRALEDAFMKARIPYVIWSGLSFFERQEVKDVVAYLRLVSNPSDDAAFRRVCNRPARGISDATLSTVSTAAELDDATLLATARRLADEGGYGLKDAPRKALGAFCDYIGALSGRAATENADILAKEVVESSGILKLYADEKDDDGQKRAKNIEELLNGLDWYIEDVRREYTEAFGEEDEPVLVTLAEWLENIALLSNTDTADDGKGKVSLMTVHCAKGLEFPTVFVAGAEQGLFPLLNEKSTQFDLEEERRLFYVAVTRAKDHLIITHCNSRRRFGSPDDGCEPSQFINEMEI